MANLHISISAEPVFHLGEIAITNSILTTWAVTAFFIAVTTIFYRRIQNVTYTQKPTRFQNLVEFIIESLANFTQSIAGNYQKSRAFLPFIATFFLFIVFSNWSGLLPGVGSIGLLEKPEVVEVVASEHAPVESTDSHDESKPKFVPLFRAPTADLNTTIALALFSVVVVQIMGFKYSGLAYITKYINFKGPIDFFVGILELMSEVSKVISFAFRLFGNIFAGEVLLSVIAFLVPVVAPMPFLGLEIFVGFIQALVFSMLSLVFFNMAAAHHEHEA